jgi:peptide/nickel transport system ATP-binding protein
VVTELLTVDGLGVRFGGRHPVTVVSDVSFTVRSGEIVVLVGESGCGKSVIASALMRLLPTYAEMTGSARLGSTDLLSASESYLASRVRGRRLAIVMQSAATRLHPMRTIRAQILETRRELASAQSMQEIIAHAGFPADHLDKFPHQLSGGLAQRALIALTLLGDPEVVLADEPTVGLDAELATLITDRLRDLAAEGRGVFMITHDLHIAKRIADRILVMYAGRVVENISASSFFKKPSHPYAKGLLEALPQRAFRPIPGDPPQLDCLPQGCAFRMRCAEATEDCTTEPQSRPTRFGSVSCHHAEGVASC